MASLLGLGWLCSMPATLLSEHPTVLASPLSWGLQGNWCFTVTAFYSSLPGSLCRNSNPATWCQALEALLDPLNPFSIVHFCFQNQHYMDDVLLLPSSATSSAYRPASLDQHYMDDALLLPSSAPSSAYRAASPGNGAAHSRLHLPTSINSIIKQSFTGMPTG